jgi:hypothetical protein
MNDMRLYRELDELPTLAQGQADDLKIDTRDLETGVDFEHGGSVRVWVSRVERGEIEAERCINGRYVPGDDDDIMEAVAAARFDGVL